MIEIFRKLFFACVGLAAFIAILMASVFVGLLLLAVGVVFVAYVKMKHAGVIGSQEMPRDVREDAMTIEADYEVLDENEEPERQDKA
jgi:predicted membrane protein